MNDEIKIRIAVTKGSLLLAEMHSVISGGRHEFVFQQPIRTDSGRSFEGFSLELWLDREPRLVTFSERPGHELSLKR
jgi:hypothetical protein